MGLKVQDLVVLAGGAGQKDDLSQYDSLPDGIREALMEELEADRKNAAKGAAKEIVNILKTADARVESRVAQIREYRRKIEQLKHELDTIDAAKEMGLKDNNFIPLAAELGLIHHSELHRIGRENPKLLEVVRPKKTSTTRKTASTKKS